jgi:phosphatidylserine decarboxylase
MRKILILSLLVILIFLSWFYRFPSQNIIYNNEDKVYSPAYGKVMSIKDYENDSLYIAIFLSPLDIHYQFFPFFLMLVL